MDCGWLLAKVIRERIVFAGSGFVEYKERIYGSSGMNFVREFKRSLGRLLEVCEEQN